MNPTSNKPSQEFAVHMPEGYVQFDRPDFTAGNDGGVSQLSTCKGNKISGSDQDDDTDSSAPAVMVLGVTYNTNNYGVRVLLSGAVQSLVAARDKVCIRILDYQHRPAAWPEATTFGLRSVSLVNLRYSWRLHLPNNIFRLIVLALMARLIPSATLRKRMLGRNPWVNHILTAKQHFSLAGGDSFSDIYGLGRLLYVTLPQLLVLLLGKPLILLPQTYGPFKGSTARWIARFILRRASAIYSRDQEGAEAIRRLIGQETRVRVVPDVGFSMEPDPVAPEILKQMALWRTRGPVVGLNVSKLLYIGGYNRNNMFGLKEEHSAFVHRLIDRLLLETSAFLLLVPHVFGEVGETEVVLCRDLLPELEKRHPGRVGFIDRSFSHREIKGVIGQCDVFAGGRMHACIAAVSQCVPTVALAYSDKFAGVMNVVGSSGVHVLDLRQSGADEGFLALKQAIDSRTEQQRDLCKKIPMVKESIRAVFSSEVLKSK